MPGNGWKQSTCWACLQMYYQEDLFRLAPRQTHIWKQTEEKDKPRHLISWITVPRQTSGLVVKTLNIRMLGFEACPWHLMPAFCQCRAWRGQQGGQVATVTAQVSGFLSLIWDAWDELTAPRFQLWLLPPLQTFGNAVCSVFVCPPQINTWFYFCKWLPPSIDSKNFREVTHSWV